jgi:hypothetical protein
VLCRRGLDMAEQKIKHSIILRGTKCVLVALVILLFLGQPLLPARGAGTGTVLLQVAGYGSVRGQLENATILANNAVTMIMTVNDQIQTPQGAFPIEATGRWSGILNGSVLSGTINDVTGKVQICVLVCSDADFVGQGNWSGMLNASMNADGNFTAAIEFTNSPYPQIPDNQPVPTDGSWQASFVQPVPEFHLSWGIMLLAALVVVSISVSRSGLHKSKL